MSALAIARVRMLSVRSHMYLVGLVARQGVKAANTCQVIHNTELQSCSSSPLDIPYLQGAMPMLHHERMYTISSRLPALVLDYVWMSQRPQNLCLLRKSLTKLKYSITL